MLGQLLFYSALSLTLWWMLRRVLLRLIIRIVLRFPALAQPLLAVAKAFGIRIA